MASSAAVREMFRAIAPRYDFLNHLLSAGIDRRWRKRAVAMLDLRPGERVLDLCCGTGDLSFALARTGADVTGCDFVTEMLMIAKEKSRREKLQPRFSLADALRLPFLDGQFDAAAVAFGIRNVDGLDAGLAEMARVLRPGGRMMILEFTTPPNRLFRSAFEPYFHSVLPRVGNALAGAPTDAYAYLPDSVRRFPDAPTLAERMRAAGLERVHYEYLTFGVAAVHLGERP